MVDQPLMPQQYQPLKPMIERMIVNDFNRFIQDMDPQLREFELFLAGQRIVKDDQGSVVLLQECKPRVNHIGRQEIISRMKMYLNTNTWMSQITEEDTEKNFVIEAVAIHRMLAENHMKYELTLPNARVIADIMCSTVFHALRKSETDKPTVYGTMNSSNQQPLVSANPLGGLTQGMFKQ